jgi:hypothetical protein
LCKPNARGQTFNTIIFKANRLKSNKFLEELAFFLDEMANRVGFAAHRPKKRRL